MLKLNDPTIQEILSRSGQEGGNIMFNDPAFQEIVTEVTADQEHSIPIIECLLAGRTTDEEIAEKTEIRLNIVRRILYKLYDAGVASYKRSKDPETQWYTYNWKFEEEKITEIISVRFQKQSEEVTEILEYEEENMFFICQLCHSQEETGNGFQHLHSCRYKFEEASEYNFACPECGSNLEYHDNTNLIVQLRELKEKIN